MLVTLTRHIRQITERRGRVARAARCQRERAYVGDRHLLARAAACTQDRRGTRQPTTPAPGGRHCGTTCCCRYHPHKSMRRHFPRFYFHLFPRFYFHLFCRLCLHLPETNILSSGALLTNCRCAYTCNWQPSRGASLEVLLQRLDVSCTVTCRVPSLHQPASPLTIGLGPTQNKIM